MAVKAGHAAAAGPTDKAIRQQLARILASKTFAPVDRLKRFVEFIVSEAVAGRGGDLKEYVIGVQVFAKEASFDPRTDPIVRVQARRLRTRLARYYKDEGAGDEIVIDLPKGGYAPVWRRRDAAADSLPRPGALVQRNTVSVHPFADHTAEAAFGYFCRGLHDEIVHGLTAVRALRVLAPAGTAATSAHRDDAAWIVHGSVRGTAERLRVTAHVLDTASGSYVWSEAFDATAADHLAAQQRLAAAVISRLDAMASGGAPLGRAHDSDNLAARNLYLQGRYHLNQRTEEGLHKAVDFFEKALAEDPQLSLAHSGLADAYGLLAHYGVLGPADVWARAASSAASAVMLDPHSAEAHTSLAHVHATQDWDWTAAEREFHQAIRRNPRYATAHHWFAMSCLVPLGRLDEALDEMLLAQSLDPVSAIISRDLAVIHLYRRDLDAALEQSDHTIELNPHFAPAYRTLGLIQEQRRDFDEAAAAFSRAVDLAPHSPQMQSALARTLALSGTPDAARATLASLEALAAHRYVSPFEFATIHLALGDVDRGCAALARACDDRCFEMLALHVDPRFAHLADHPPFLDILRRVGLRASRS